VAKYSLRLILKTKKSARKDLESIATKADRQRIVKRIMSLADKPRPKGSQKLSGLDRYRIRQGGYKILYSIRDAELVVYVVKIAGRKDAYRG